MISISKIKYNTKYDAFSYIYIYIYIKVTTQ